MVNKTTLSPSPWPAPRSVEGKAGQPVNGHTADVVADDDDLDERFREAIQRGDINGDVVFLDERGNEIKDSLSNKTIFDL